MLDMTRERNRVNWNGFHFLFLFGTFSLPKPKSSSHFMFTSALHINKFGQNIRFNYKRSRDIGDVNEPLWLTIFFSFRRFETSNVAANVIRMSIVAANVSCPNDVGQSQHSKFCFPKRLLFNSSLSTQFGIRVIRVYQVYHTLFIASNSNQTVFNESGETTDHQRN